MCDLCESGDDLKKARENMEGIADRLRALANLHDSMASGRLKPHTDESKRVGERASSMIRQLAEHWL